jgi:uncharacterized membrane protein
VKKIERSIVIAAPPGEVFPLIQDIEGISRFSTSIIEVRKISNNISSWKMDISGIELEWHAETEREHAPDYLSWRSISGLENKGAYVLEALDGKTKVCFFM